MNLDRVNTVTQMMNSFNELADVFCEMQKEHTEMKHRLDKLESEKPTITRRDLFAAAAMAALVRKDNADRWDISEHASVAKVCADNLITALDATKP